MSIEREVIIMDYVIYFIVDILLGFVPQAMGCAVCLYAFTGQTLKNRSFLVTSAIFSGVAVVVRLICNFGVIDFGFHTILIWILFVVVAITYNKLPVMQSVIAIMLSSLLILATELLVCVVVGSIVGMERFNQIMNYDITRNTVQEATLRSIYGIPMNVVFASVALIVYYFVKKHRAKKSASTNSEQGE